MNLDRTFNGQDFLHELSPVPIPIPPYNTMTVDHNLDKSVIALNMSSTKELTPNMPNDADTVKEISHHNSDGNKHQEEVLNVFGGQLQGFKWRSDEVLKKELELEKKKLEEQMLYNKWVTRQKEDMRQKQVG